MSLLIHQTNFTCTFYARHRMTHISIKETEKAAKKNKRVLSLKIREKIVSNDAKTPDEVRRETGPLD